MAIQTVFVKNTFRYSAPILNWYVLKQKYTKYIRKDAQNVTISEPLLKFVLSPESVVLCLAYDVYD